MADLGLYEKVEFSLNIAEIFYALLICFYERLVLPDIIGRYLVVYLFFFFSF